MLGWRRLLDLFNGNLEACICKLVGKGLAVAFGDALENMRTGAFVRFGSRADAVLNGRKSFLMVIVIVGIAIFDGAVEPSGLTMKYDGLAGNVLSVDIGAMDAFADIETKDMV